MVATYLKIAEEKGRPAIISHRGHASDGIHKDSLSAFIQAKELGADAVEFDARLTGDGQVVIHHNPFLFTRKGIIRLSSHPLAELKEKMNDPKDLPSFNEIYAILGDFPMFVQIKNPTDAASIIHHIQNIIPDDKMDNLVFMGYVHAAVQNHLYQNLHWGKHYYFPITYNLNKIRESMKNPGFGIISPYIGYITSRHMKKIKKMNTAIIPFSVNSKRTINFSLKNRVEGIYTDKIPLALKILDT